MEIGGQKKSSVCWGEASLTYLVRQWKSLFYLGLTHLYNSKCACLRYTEGSNPVCVFRELSQWILFLPPSRVTSHIKKGALIRSTWIWDHLFCLLSFSFPWSYIFLYTAFNIEWCRANTLYCEIKGEVGAVIFSYLRVCLKWNNTNNKTWTFRI